MHDSLQCSYSNRPSGTKQWIETLFINGPMMLVRAGQEPRLAQEPGVGLKRVEQWDHKAIAKPAGIVWLDKNEDFCPAKRYQRALRSPYGPIPLLVLLPANSETIQTLY